MRKILAAVVAVAVIAGGAYYFVKRESQGSLKVAVDDALHRLPPDWEVTYDSLDIAPADRTVTIRGLVVHYRPQPDAELKIGELTVENPSLDLARNWNKAVADPAGVTEDTSFPIADAVSVKDLAFKNTTGSGTLGSGRLAALEAYPWALTRPGLPAIADLPGLLAKLKENPTKEEGEPLIRLCAATMLAESYGSMSLENLSEQAHIPPTAGMPESDVVETFRKFEDDGLDRGVMKHAAAEGIEIKSGVLGNTTVDRVVAEGLDFRGSATLLAANGALDAQALDGFALGKFEIAGMTVRPPTGQTIAIGGIGFGNIAVAGGLPISGEIHLSKLDISRDMMPNEEAKAAFEQLDLDRATVSFSYAFDWDTEKHRFRVHDTSLAVDQLGTLDFAADAVDVTPGPDWQQSARLAHAVVHYHDNSLVDRAFRAGAKKAGGDPAALRQQALAGVQMALIGFAGDPAAAAALQQIGVFLGAPKSLTIELTPKEPYSFAALQAAGSAPTPDLPSKLGLLVTANR